MAKNSHRLDKAQATSNPARPSSLAKPASMNPAAPQTEQQKIEAMMKAGSDQWELEKQRMAE